jgi:hypothetical protein
MAKMALWEEILLAAEFGRPDPLGNPAEKRRCQKDWVVGKNSDDPVASAD